MWRDSRATSSWAACCSVAEAGRLLINGLSVTPWAQAWGGGDRAQCPLVTVCIFCTVLACWK